ncbi:MAG: gfo/Idh/MocA family oxidoreductase [Gammaproteobacteria bacterium]|nr:gfo/Idh/MocA family oxidoreductase [Gammaproteobacteria bacterium]NKB63942.1 gfo/Idh/MocA family oxidoreductase [Gammaproteobacteria bacterium]
MEKPRIAVVGAGLIGKTHASLISESEECVLAAIVDPRDATDELAKTLGVPRLKDFDALLLKDDLDGVIIATPNHFHVEQGIRCLKANLPALIEKPVAHNYAEGERLRAAAETSTTPLLVGHHRMHSPIMGSAREFIDSGALGKLVSISGSALFLKPDDYFVAGEWRTRPGGGPILINMIHEIGNLRYLCGEIVAVQAISSHAQRGYAVEDTVGMVFSFANGAIGTFVLSDTAGSARSWEQTSQEDRRYPSYSDEDCYHIAGTDGSISLPTMRVKRYPNQDERSWWKPFKCSSIEINREDPLKAQLSHFCQVIQGNLKPRVSVHDALQNLLITDAIVEAASCGRTVDIKQFRKHLLDNTMNSA